MNKNWLGIAAVVIAIVMVIWMLTGTEISCHRSFWDKDKQVLEIRHD